MSLAKRKALDAGRGAVAVVGMKDRDTNEVIMVVETTDADTLPWKTIRKKTRLFTDGAPVYDGLDREHEKVFHSVGEYVRGMAHTNLNPSGPCSSQGRFTKSARSLQRYIDEFAGKHNIRLDTLVQCVTRLRGR